jgi:murein DD-endopeptidase MepM/ murein hydrolase activator NlpD
MIVSKKPNQFVAATALLLASSNAFAWHEVVALEHVASGKFVTAKSDGSITVDAGSIGASEKFTLLDLNFGTLLKSDPVALRSSLGRFVTVAGAPPVTAQAPSPGATETFEFRVRDGLACAVASRPGQCDGVVIQLARTADNTCLAADPSGGSMAPRPCGTSGDPTTLFRVRFPPEQPALLSLSAPFDAPQALTPFEVTGVDHKHITGGSPAGNNDCTDAFGHFAHCYGGHEGTDFPMTLGFVGMVRSIDVIAAAPGFVVNVDNNFSDLCFWDPTAPGDRRCIGATPGKFDWNVVGVVQDDGVIVRYGHLKRGSVTVSPGQRVECGAVLGKVGSSGRSTGPHLHFDMAQLSLPQPVSCSSGAAVRPLPSIPAVAVPGSSPFDAFSATSGPGCAKSARLDPYDPAIAAPRITLWLASGASHIPKQFCAASKSGLPPLPGGPGAACRGERNCRPWLICASSGVCEPPRDTGQTCAANRDCAWALRCDNGLCTRYGLPPRATCDSVHTCGPLLVCASGRCTLDPALTPGNLIPSGEDGCPAGERMRCPLYRGCGNVGDDCRRPALGGSVSCERECSP